MPGVTLEGTDLDIDWGLATPRVQIAFDVFGDGRTTAYGSWGRTLSPLSTSVATWEHPFISDPYRGAEAFLFTDSNNNQKFDSGEPMGESAFLGSARTDNPAFLVPVNRVDPGLEGPTEDTTVGGLGFEFGRRLTLDVRYIHRSFGGLADAFDLVNGRQVSSRDYVPGIVVNGMDLEGDPFTLQTSRIAPGLDTGGSLLANSGATRPYDALELSFATRRANRWRLRDDVSLAGSSESVPETTFRDANDLRGTFDSDGAAYAQQSPSVDKADVFVVPGWSYRVAGMYQVVPDRPWGFNLSGQVYARQG